MKISLSLIAEKARTSKATVSRAFNYTPGISTAKRNKIFKIAADLGYIHDTARSEHAKMLRPGASLLPTTPAKRTHVATLVYYKTSRDHIHTVPYYRTLTSLLDSTFRSEGMTLMEAYPQDETEYRRIIESSASDGIIIMGNIQHLSPELINIMKLQANVRPLIFLSNYHPSFQNQFHCVRSDDVTVGYTAADYCCKTGSDEVVFIDSALGMAVVEDRHQGYRRALEQHGRKAARIPFHVENWSFNNVSSITDKSKLPSGPVCYLGSADSTVFYFIEFLKKEKLFDPLRMRFVGMDGIPGLSPGDIREATVQVDLEAMARETYHILNDSFEGKVTKPKSILVGCELLTRPVLATQGG